MRCVYLGDRMARLVAVRSATRCSGPMDGASFGGTALVVFADGTTFAARMWDACSIADVYPVMTGVLDHTCGNLIQIASDA